MIGIQYIGAKHGWTLPVQQIYFIFGSGKMAKSIAK